MVRLEQVWRERISWLQSSGLTVAAGSKELGVSVASVYRWKKLLAETLCSGEQQPIRRRRTIPATAAPQTTLPLVAVRIRDEAPSVTAARPAATGDVSRTVLKITLPNGVVIHVSEDLDGQRLGDVVIAAGQIPRTSAMTTACSEQAGEVLSC
jgi:hypothetical protein